MSAPRTAEVVLRAHDIIAAAGIDPSTARPETWLAAEGQARLELAMEEVQAILS